MIKIFHFADLHLDSPFAGCDIKASENGRKRLRDAFLRMMKRVSEGGYDLVLIPGDLYESGYLTAETAELVMRTLGALPCPVVISPGNHDPYCKGSLYTSMNLPENVHVFSSEELSYFDFDDIGVRVYGYAFTEPSLRRGPLAGEHPEHGGRIPLLCAHADVSSPLSPYAPLSYADAEDAGIVYAALGHIHNAPPVFRSERTTCAYSGFVEGRAFDERHYGTALSVALDETSFPVRVTAEQVQIGTYRFETEQIDITAALGDEEASELVARRISERGYGSETALRAVLCGEVGTGYAPNVRVIAEKCRGELDVLEVIDDTSPILDGAALESDITLRGELYRTLKEKLCSGSGEERRVAALALRLGLAALEGRDISVFLPDTSPIE
ncbi:MAG: exonuclease SbcCD subunit D [Eubacteriales bacterium]